MNPSITSLIGKGIYYFLMLMDYAILIRVILSWFMDPFSRIMQVFVAFTEPIIAPIRMLLSRFTGQSMMRLDFAPFITMFVLSLVRNIVIRIFM